MPTLNEEMYLAIVGHVDHGKSSILGRLLANINALPEGKLDAVKTYCKNNAKPFEYAFLLDALKAEQAQGITIDTARCFFSTHKRRYIILDTPGHLEFLRNMVTGASHAEAALLIIDAAEGARDNSYRHGHLLSLLGIKQVAVVINKMDLVNYDKTKFNDIKNEYARFLKSINVTPFAWIPTSARAGDNISELSDKMPWHQGDTIISCIENFKTKEAKNNRPLRFPVQDVYKFTEDNDNRRIIAGTIESGKIQVGDKVRFSPSGQETTIKTIELFNSPILKTVHAGHSIGFTLSDELYIKPGDLMYNQSETAPQTSRHFKANVFWLGQLPLSLKKQYKIKLGTTTTYAYIDSFISTLDAKNLDRTFNKDISGIEKNHIAECNITTENPIAFDLIDENDSLARFVIVDDYEISGGGIITETIKAPKQEPNKITSKFPELLGINSKPLNTNDRTIYILKQADIDKTFNINSMRRNLDKLFESYYILTFSPKNNNLQLDKLREVVHHLSQAGIQLVIVSEEKNLSELITTLNSIPAADHIKTLSDETVLLEGKTVTTQM